MIETKSVTEITAEIDLVRDEMTTAFTGELAPVAAQALRQGLLVAKENVVLAVTAETDTVGKAYANLAAKQILDAIEYGVWQLRHKGVEHDAVDLKVMRLAGTVRYLRG